MKKYILLTVSFVLAGLSSGYSQTIPKADSLGLPGDNLNLYAVLDLFQKSETFEIFEKKLNEEGSKINNLDLNNDDKTDYIKVIDHQTGDAHSVVLQVPINEKENQDVAVIEIEKDKSGKIVVQIVGDEDLYGKNYIVEPQENDPTTKKATATNPNTKSDTTRSKDGKTVIINNTTNNYYGGSSSNNNVSSNAYDENYVYVSAWPVIHYIYSPAYVVYVSPWYWYSYPMWWHPWAPWYWHDYYWHHYNYNYNYYHGCYHRSYLYRNNTAHTYYGSRRASSMTVQNGRSKGMYIKTYDAENKTNAGRDKPSQNPGYKGNPSNNNNRQDGNAVPNKGSNKPTYEPSRFGKPASKPSYSKPETRQAPQTSKPSTPRQSTGQSRRSSGGGGRSTGGGGKRRDLN